MFTKEQEEALAYLMPLFHYLVTHNHHFPPSVCPLSCHKSCLTIFLHVYATRYGYLQIGVTNRGRRLTTYNNRKGVY